LYLFAQLGFITAQFPLQRLLAIPSHIISDYLENMRRMILICALAALSAADHSKYCNNKRENVDLSLVRHIPAPTYSGSFEKMAVTFCRPEILQKHDKIELDQYNSYLKIDGDYIRVGPEEKVDKIKDDTFSNLKDLKTLIVQQMDVEEVEPHAFRGLDNLRQLSLYKNLLKSLPAGVFDDVPNLRELNLEDNKLESLDEHLFDKLTKLEQLTIGINELTSLPANWYAGLSNLKNLHIPTNKFKVLRAGMFEGLSELRELDLDVNRIEKIEKDAFKGLDKLQVLSMAYNQKMEANFSRELETYLTNLKTLHASADNFECSDYEKMVKILKERNVDNSFFGQCWTEEQWCVVKCVDVVNV